MHWPEFGVASGSSQVSRRNPYGSGPRKNEWVVDRPGVLVATALWLGGRRALWVLAFPPVALELYYGNVCNVDKLLLNVCLPGTAGGSTRVAVEPTPLGYAIQNTAGAHAAASRQYDIDQIEFENAGGRAAAGGGGRGEPNSDR